MHHSKLQEALAQWKAIWNEEQEVARLAALKEELEKRAVQGVTFDTLHSLLHKPARASRLGEGGGEGQVGGRGGGVEALPIEMLRLLEGGDRMGLLQDTKGSVFVWLSRTDPRVLQWRWTGGTAAAIQRGTSSAAPAQGIICATITKLSKLQTLDGSSWAVTSPSGILRLKASSPQVRDTWLSSLRQLMLTCV